MSREISTPFADRLAQLLNERFQGNQSALSRAAGLPAGSLASYLKGSSLPGFEKLIGICRAADVNSQWLLTGEGPMLRGETGDVAGVREELSVQVERWKAEAEAAQGRVRQLEAELAAERETARVLVRATEHSQARGVADSKAVEYQVDRIRILEAENEALRDRLKKLESDEKATQVK